MSYRRYAALESNGATAGRIAVPEGAPAAPTDNQENMLTTASAVSVLDPHHRSDPGTLAGLTNNRFDPAAQEDMGKNYSALDPNSISKPGAPAMITRDQHFMDKLKPASGAGPRPEEPREVPRNMPGGGPA